MGKIRFTLTNLIFWLVLCLSCFLFENIGLLTANPAKGFDLGSFVGISVLILMLMVFYFIVEHKKNKMTIHWVYLPALVILFVCSTIRIVTLKDYTFTNATTGYVSTVTFSNVDKIKFIVELGIGCILLYILLFAFSKGRASVGKYKFFVWALILVVIVAIGASFYLDREYYKEFLHPTLTDFHPNVKSFFFNPNTYAAAIMLGIFGCGILCAYKPRWYLYALMLVFLFFIVFTYSLGPTLMSLFFVVVFFIFECFKDIKARHKRFATKFVILLLLAVGLVVLVICAKIWNIPYVSRFLRSIWHNIKDSDKSTFSNRVEIWKEAFKVLMSDKLSFFFGTGYGSSRVILNGALQAMHSSAEAPFTAHNGYVQVLFDFGLVGVILYITLFVFFIYSVILCFTYKKKRWAFIYLLALFSYSVYAIIESTYICDLHTEGMVATILMFLPILQARQNFQHNERIEEFKQIESPKERMDGHRMTQVLTMVISSVLFAFGIVAAIVFRAGLKVDERKLYLLVILCLAFGSIFVPYMVTLWHKKRSHKGFVAICIIHTILILGVSACAIPVYKFVPSIHALPYAKWWIIPAFCAGAILIDFIFSFMIKRGRFVDWIVDGIKGGFVMPFAGLITTLGFAPLGLCLICSKFPNTTALRFVVFVAFIIGVYYVATLTFRTKGMKEILAYYNNRGINSFKRHLEKDGI